MGKFAFMPWTADLLGGATLTPSSEDSAYPRANLSALPVSKPFRFTGCASESLLWDLGSAKLFDFFALCNHNLTSGASITLKAGSTSAASDYSLALAWREWDVFAFLAAAQTYRYVKLELADAANPDGFIEAGLALGGPAVYPVFDFEDDWTVEDREETLSVESEFGTPNVQALFQQVRLSCRFRGVLESDFETLRTAFLALHKDANPVFLAPDRSLPVGWFGRFVNHLSRRYPRPSGLGRVVESALEFVMDGRGNRLSA